MKVLESALDQENMETLIPTTPTGRVGAAKKRKNICDDENTQKPAKKAKQVKKTTKVKSKKLAPSKGQRQLTSFFR